MPSAATDLTARIAEEAAALPAEKQGAILDFVLFVKQRAETSTEIESEGDAAWERISNDPRPRPKMEAFIKRALAEGSELLDISKL